MVEASQNLYCLHCERWFYTITKSQMREHVKYCERQQHKRFENKGSTPYGWMEKEKEHGTKV